MRDHYSSDTSQIIVDNNDSYKALKEFARMVMPTTRNLVKLYKETKPLFSEYKVEEQIESIYKRSVPLPSGGTIVIDIGEAMASIDVNSGRTKGGLDLEETAATTNLEAAKEIARQLRLRDLGGLIVIDFIDMYQKKNKAAVEKELKLACKSDKARINLSRISKFGLLEMSRQRISPPVKDGIFEECSQCMGSGLVRSINSIVLLVFRKVQELIAQGGVKVISLEISPEVATYILNKKMNAIFDLKEKYQLGFKFINKPGLSFENFKFEVLETKEEVDEETTKLGKIKNKETSKKEGLQTQITTETEGAQKLDAATSSTQPKRRYSQRKPTSRRAQTRGRGKRPYNSRKNLERDGSKQTAEEKSTPPDFIKTGEKQFNKPPDNIDGPIIPLPAPYVRPKVESDSPGSVPDGNVNDG